MFSVHSYTLTDVLSQALVTHVTVFTWKLSLKVTVWQRHRKTDKNNLGDMTGSFVQNQILCINQKMPA
jgi:hypothetical protein